VRIVRFQTPEGSIHLGHDLREDSAVLLEGELFGNLEETGRRLPVVRLLAPLDPAAIICIGLNYRLHAGEFGADVPRYPIVFMKNPAAVIGPGEAIVIPACCQEPPQVDYETELVAIIGRTAKNVSADQALDYVFGYTIGNDVSARRWQKEAGGGQWVRGKSFDTFCPLGPAIVTADEITDPQNLRLSCHINGRLMQDGHTTDMLFSVAELISYLSTDTTLRPGTIIMTGTPAGVGFARTPPVWLTPGDVIRMTIEPVGTLENPVAGV